MSNYQNYPDAPPMHSPYPSYPPYIHPQPGDGMATASMILGILSLVVFPFNLILGILGIIFSIRARNLGCYPGGKATAGLVCSIISVVISLLVIGLIAPMRFERSLMA